MLVCYEFIYFVLLRTGVFGCCLSTDVFGVRMRLPIDLVFVLCVCVVCLCCCVCIVAGLGLIPEGDSLC